MSCPYGRTVGVTLAEDRRLPGARVASSRVGAKSRCSSCAVMIRQAGFTNCFDSISRMLELLNNVARRGIVPPTDEQNPIAAPHTRSEPAALPELRAEAAKRLLLDLTHQFVMPDRLQPRARRADP
ncbi:hypothetical protein JCM4814A_93560 [Streptomyces phaeofaciens JCM 4814]